MTNLKGLYFISSDVDLNNMDNDTVNSIEISNCSVANIKDLNNCSSLNELNFSKVVINNKIIFVSDEDELDKKYVLKNSSDFEYLDNIEILSIRNIQIEDVSGFLKMDSLNSFTISKGSILENDRKLLEESEITIIEKIDDE
ncbi:MAG: hypothetical protein K2K06_01380 [Oscillospiraceae bacterium]|nr:hypothetical protein [Oscillospiraceae bacterium]